MGLPFSMYALREGVKSPINFYCVLHAKRGKGVQIACKIAYTKWKAPMQSKQDGLSEYLEKHCM